MASPRANGSTTSSTAAAKAKAKATDKDASAPASQDADAAIKARILKHMNADHADSLSLYLQHYSSLSAAAAHNPTLTDVTLSSLTIAAADGTTHAVALEPRLSAWSDVRPRVVAMDREARAGLGMPVLASESAAAGGADGEAGGQSVARGGRVVVVVRSYEAARAPLHVFMILLVGFFFATYGLLEAGVLGPGTWYWERVMAYFPVGGAEGYAWLNVQLAVPVMVLHGIEAGWMVGRLRTHGVAVGTGLWWKWVGAAFLEGFGAHQRFSGVVRRGGGAKNDARRRRN